VEKGRNERRRKYWCWSSSSSFSSLMDSFYFPSFSRLAKCLWAQFREMRRVKNFLRARPHSPLSFFLFPSFLSPLFVNFKATETKLSLYVRLPFPCLSPFFWFLLPVFSSLAKQPETELRSLASDLFLSPPSPPFYFPFLPARYSTSGRKRRGSVDFLP